jgi:ABC-type uncharacterized transport system auxiliary subunit
MSPRAVVLPALLAALVAAGCIRLGGSGTPVERRCFDLQPPLPAPEPPETEALETLWVEPFGVDPALDRTEIVWRRAAGEAGAYERYTWARPPEEAVRSYLADVLSRSGAFGLVATEPRALGAEYSLRGHLVRFEEVDGEKEWSGSLEVRVALLRVSDGTEILRRVYARSERAPLRNPAGVVEALRAALASVGRELAADVRQVMEAERDRDAPARPAPRPPANAPPSPAR